MELTNSVYSVTPPSLFLNDNGPSVFLIGFGMRDIKRISKAFDTMFSSNSITYFYDEKNINEVTAPWARAVSGMVDFIVINADNCNIEEVLIATTRAQHTDDEIPVYWISENRINPALCKLLISYNHRLFPDVDELETIVLTDLMGQMGD